MTATSPSIGRDTTPTPALPTKLHALPTSAKAAIQPWSAELVAEQLRLSLDYQPTPFYWRINLNQLSWLPATLGIVGVALNGTTAQIYWALLVATTTGCLLRQDTLKGAIATKATAAAQRELLPAAKTLLKHHPETITALQTNLLTNKDRQAMTNWARNHHQRNRAPT